MGLTKSDGASNSNNFAFRVNKATFLISSHGGSHDHGKSSHKGGRYTGTTGLLRYRRHARATK
jgi:hypothetical protein